MKIRSKTIKEIDREKEKENLKKIEAILFISGKFLTMRDLISLSDLNPIVIRDLIEKLKKRYNNDNSAIEIVEKNNLWKMDVKSDYMHLVNRIASGNSEFTRAEQETLAIIAVKQPVKQSVIAKIRGNKSYEHLKKFEELGLIKRKRFGHTKEITLTEEFYDYFNIAKEKPA